MPKPAPDLSEFEALSGRPASICGVRRLDLPPEQQQKLDAAIESPTISAQAISKVLGSWGHKVSGQVIGRHRRGTCSCER